MIVIKEEFRTCIDPLSDDEYGLLKESILSEGCREDLILWGEILIDGHNRKNICDAHNIPYNTRQIEFESEDDALLWIIRNQLARRNISAFVRAELALQMKPLLAKKS